MKLHRVTDLLNMNLNILHISKGFTADLVWYDQLLVQCFMSTKMYCKDLSHSAREVSL